MNYNDKTYHIQNSKDENKRSRYWACLIYPDSCDPDYYNILKSYGIKAAISPLHDHDLIDKGENMGLPDKPHRHILFKFNGGYRLADVVQFVDAINGNTYVQIVKDCTVFFEYLYHANDPDKYQYSPKDILFVNSNRFDYLNSEYREILNFIDDHNCFGFRSLTKLLRVYEQYNLLEYVSKNPYYIRCYMEDNNKVLYGHMQSLLARIVEICDNIDEDIYPDKEEIKIIRNTASQYIVDTPDDVQF